ncbi:hypothetical protein FXO37_14998 [Capsicum annuum]|nr:hypothetical protein FXO37_14998 [Capsicum annuum]
MAENTAKLRSNSVIRTSNLVSDYVPLFSLGLTQNDVVKVVSNLIQSKKSVSLKEIRSKFHNDPVKMIEILKNKKMKKTDSPKEQKTKKCEKKGKPKKSKKDDFVFDEDIPNRLVEKYFNGAEFIQKRQLFIAFMDKVWGEINNEDAKKFTILYFLHSFVLSNVDTVVIPRLHFDLGLPLAIQVWLYECCSNVPRKIASKVDNRIPQLLNWKTNAPQPRFEYLMDAMFNDDGKEQFADKQDKQPNVDGGGLEKSQQHFNPDVVQSSDNIVDDTKQQYADKDPELQHMGYTVTKTSPQRFSPNVDQNLGENLDGTKTNKENTDLSLKSPVHAKVELDTEEQIRTPPNTQQLTTDEQRDEQVWPDSQNTIPDEFLPSLNVYK